ncbi:MAG: hypothetical protein ACYS8Z_18145 [Planctomycetota bacterium]|jgi:hypothetical protein
MNRERFFSILSKCDPWRLMVISLAVGVAVVAGALVFELAALSWQNDGLLNIAPNSNTTDSYNLSGLLNPESKSIRDLGRVMRTGLFRPATPSRDRPMADKTIERIKSQLQLKCITNLNGEPVAYVKIKGVGLRRCKPGDTVNDLFTVIEIHPERIEIKIVGHRTMLDL